MEARQTRLAPQRPFEISLRIRHPSLDPGAISRELHLETTHCFKAGQPRRGDPGGSAHTETYWLARLDPGAIGDPAGLAADRSQSLRLRQLNEALAGSLDPALAIVVAHLRRHGAFLRRIQLEGGQVGLRVELAPAEIGGFSLIPHVARALSEMGIVIEFEFVGGS